MEMQASNQIAQSLQPVTQGSQRRLARFTRPLAKLGFLPVIVVPLLLLAGAMQPGVYWWARILAGLAGAAGIGIIARILAFAVIADPDHLVIRNFRNTHRIPWAEIEEISLTPAPSAATYLEQRPPSTAVEPDVYVRRGRGPRSLTHLRLDLLIKLKEGSVIEAALYRRELFWDNRGSRKKAVQQLNELLGRLAPGAGDPSSVAGSGRDLLS
jgi:hypothetical protein